MFKLIDYQPQHVAELVAAGVKQPEVEAADILGRAELLGKFPAITGICDGKVVCSGGMIIMYPEHRAESWTYLINDIEKYRVNYKMIRKQVIEWMAEFEIVRLEAPLRMDFEPGIRFARHMGFRHEAILEKYHPGNVDAWMHVIIKG